MNITDLTQYFPETVATGITGVISYYIGRRKNKAETQITEVEAVEKVAKIWRELASDLEMQVKELQSEVKMLIKENKELKVKISEINISFKNDHSRNN